MSRFIKTIFISMLTLLLLRVCSAASPAVTVSIQPDPAYTDSLLYGRGAYTDPDGDYESGSTYRWLINSVEIESGTIPQVFLLSLDGDLITPDGEPPIIANNISFVTGRFGQAIQLSSTADSRLQYTPDGNVDLDTGTVEMWINLSYDLDDPIYNDYPRFFTAAADDQHELYMEINADRIILTSIRNGQYYGTWPDPPGWSAGEWHHVAATWSSADSASAIYYDGEEADTGSYVDLNATTVDLQIGGRNTWAEVEAVLDEIRICNRVLTANEIRASFNRNQPMPNDELLLFPDQTATGDTVTLEITPCDDTGACGIPGTATVTIGENPLGSLSPSPRHLPSGTGTVTLEITTLSPADCRWCRDSELPYASMPNDFQTGQGTTEHSTLVSGLTDLEFRKLYVKCAAASDAGRDWDPDAMVRSTQIRVLGPDAADYPRIANLWGDYVPAVTPEFYAGYNLYISGWWNAQSNASDAIRSLNPNTKILLTQNATYSNPAYDPLTLEWWNAEPGDPGYPCLLRDTTGAILLVDYWDHPMYNMTCEYCREILAAQSITNFLAPDPADGNMLKYDGIYWDRLHDTISWLDDDIDSDLNGVADDPEILDAAYLAGMEDFFTRMRAAVPFAVLMGNDGPQIYSPWINGRCYEWQLANILNGGEWLSWVSVTEDYRDWCAETVNPNTVFIECSPEPEFEAKYTYSHISDIPPAMEAEAAASYPRMRFGLATALMGDGDFSYDWGPDWHGNLWWYDEFGANPASPDPALPPMGYLGQPAGDPFLLDPDLPTPNQVENGDFENGTTGWYFYTAPGASATMEIDPTGGWGGTAAAHVTTVSADDYWDVELNNRDITTVAGTGYTVSFHARSSTPCELHLSVNKQVSPWTSHGFNVSANLTDQWQAFALCDDASVTANNGKLNVYFGDVPGEIWIDNVSFQEGTRGVYARAFDNGLVVLNSTSEVKTVDLPDTFYKIDGSQAPLFAVRVDDDAAVPTGSWTESGADFNQFGDTVHSAATGSGATMRYTPDLRHSGMYTVYTWVSPEAGQSASAAVTVHHAQGEWLTSVDQSAGEIGWRNLGAYPFDAGTTGWVEMGTTGTGVVVADAFKWETTARYNDGQPVSQLTVYPRDGIVLMDSPAPQPLPDMTLTGILILLCGITVLLFRKLGR